MGQTFAGTLGLLAFVSTVLRGVLAGGEASAVLGPAMVSLVVFTVVGFGLGQLAAWQVETAITAQLKQARNQVSPSTNDPEAV